MRSTSVQQLLWESKLQLDEAILYRGQMSMSCLKHNVSWNIKIFYQFHRKNVLLLFHASLFSVSQNSYRLNMSEMYWTNKTSLRLPKPQEFTECLWAELCPEMFDSERTLYLRRLCTFKFSKSLPFLQFWLKYLLHYLMCEKVLFIFPNRQRSQKSGL